MFYCCSISSRRIALVNVFLGPAEWWVDVINSPEEKTKKKKEKKIREKMGAGQAVAAGDKRLAASCQSW